MITTLLVWGLTWFDNIFVSKWVTNILDFMEDITYKLDLADTFILPLIKSMQVIVYFVPTTHFLVFVSIIVACTGLKIYAALYHGIVKLKPK